MPRSLPWFRLYTEARTDRKLSILTLAERGVWINLLCYAAEQETRGTFDASDRDALAAECADFDGEALDATLAKLVKVRHLIDAGGGRMAFRTFDERQQVRDYRYPSEEPEAVRARVAKSRANHPVKHANVTSSNDSLHVVTGHVTSVTSRNDLVTTCNDHIEIENRERDHDLHSGHVETDPFAAASDDARRTGAGNGSAVIDISLMAPATPPGKTRRAKATRDVRAEDDTSAAPPASSPHAVRVNPLWDALVEEFGYEPGTPKERSKWGEVVKNLKAVQATAGDVHERCAHHRAGVAAGVLHWTLTPNALVTHWGELSKPPTAAPVPISNGRARAAPGPPDVNLGAIPRLNSVDWDAVRAQAAEAEKRKDGA